MRKRFCLLLLLQLLLCSGCGIWKQHPPLEAVETAETVGLDLDAQVTASATTGSGEDDERFTASGETVPLALDALQSRSLHGGLFYGHTQYLLLGEDFARAGIQPLLDYAARSAELRLLTPVFILRGETAETALTGDPDATAQLTALARSGAPRCTALDTADRLARTGTALLGAVHYDCKEKTLTPDGCAVLKNGKLVGYLDAEAWFFGSETEKLSIPQGATVTLKQCSLQLKADWAGDTPSALRLLVDADAEVDQLDADIRITDDAVRAGLEQSLAETLAHRMAATIGQTQALEADALGLGDLLAAAHPIRWRSLHGAWETMFPGLTVTVEVTARITGTQDLSDPLPEEGET